MKNKYDEIDYFTEKEYNNLEDLERDYENEKKALSNVTYEIPFWMLFAL